MLLAGCLADGGQEPAAPPSSTEEVDDRVVVTGTDNLAWEPEELSAQAGVIEVALTCEPRVNHNIVIDELGVEVAACRPGATELGMVELDPGAYTFVCTVPGHDQLMRGTLTVDG